MKLYNYLKENRTKTISKEEAVDIITKKCHNNTKIMKQKAYIYRGISSFSYSTGYINSNTGSPRMSANTINYMTLLMDNLPSWKNYPKRSRGIICSTDEFNSDSYGNVYHVFPFDNSKIGVCPKNDAWDSFYDTFAKYTKGISSVHAFNIALKTIFEKHNLSVNEKSYSSLLNGIKKLKSLNVKNGELEQFFNEISENNVEKSLSEIFDPSFNNFKIGIKNISPDKEVWIQGEAIIVDYHEKDILNEIFQLS